MHDVFVCYATKDAARVSKIVSDLEASGLKCWMAPRDIRAGRNFQNEIIEAIDSAKAMLVFLSRAMNQSTECINEISVAKDLGSSYKLIPVRIHDVKPERGYRYYLTAAQWVEHHAAPEETVDAVFETLGMERTSQGEPIREEVPVPSSPSQDSQLGALVIKDDPTDAARTIPFAWNPFYLLFDWDGRINRRMYVFASVLQIALLSLAMVGIAMLSPLLTGMGTYGGTAWLMVLFLAYFVVIYCGISVMFKRVHDIGWSGKATVIPYYIVNALLTLGVLMFVVVIESNGNHPVGTIPGLFNFIVFLLLVFIPGQKSENKYGTKPNYSKAWEPYDREARVASALPQYDLNSLLFRANGRISQLPYLMGVLFTCWLVALLAYIEGLVGGWGSFFKYLDGVYDFGGFILHPNTWVLGLILVLGVSIIVISVFVAAKRLQDIGQSPWWSALVIVLMCTVFFGITIDYTELDIVPRMIGVLTPLLVSLPLIFIPGNRDFNRYGPPPGFRAGALRIGQAHAAAA